MPNKMEWGANAKYPKLTLETFKRVSSPFFHRATAKMKIAWLLLLLLVSVCVTASQVWALKSPFHPRDVLPLLPRQLSWPILNRLHSAVDLLPVFVGAAFSPVDNLKWKGACFYENKAWMVFHNKSGTQFGGGTLHLKVASFSSVGNLGHFFLLKKKSNFMISHSCCNELYFIVLIGEGLDQHRLVKSLYRVANGNWSYSWHIS